METRENTIRSTRVADAEKLLPIGWSPVPEDMPLRDVGELVSRYPAMRVLPVVNARQKLVGVIPVEALLDDIFFQVVPEEFLAEVRDFENSARLGRIITARVARDISQPAVSVHEDETVKVAFVRMHSHRLTGIPVVDDQNRVTGYLDMLELLLVWLRSQPRTRAKPHPLAAVPEPDPSTERGGRPHPSPHPQGEGTGGEVG
ncbi:MAG: CBS domain-containing protein [Chloroflexi bacterium]|nr:CBS domain-containing protein [Chloroflexota bacterium]